jgi:peptidylprolyl isomerase
MTTRLRFAALLLLLVTISGCRLKEEAPGDIPPPSDVAAPPADAQKTQSGLASRIIRIGLSDAKPSLRSTVVVHYTGWTTDGKMFDSSIGGAPIEAPMLRGDGRPQFIDGWMEALQLMRQGEKRRIWIPGNLAYDNIPDPPGRKPNPKGMLVFEMELLQVK